MGGGVSDNLEYGLKRMIELLEKVQAKLESIEANGLAIAQFFMGARGPGAEKIPWDDDGSCVCGNVKVTCSEGPVAGLEDVRTCQGCKRTWRVPGADTYMQAIRDEAREDEVPRPWTRWKQPGEIMSSDEEFDAGVVAMVGEGVVVRIVKMGEFRIAYCKVPKP